jgi:hypothetical protein
MADCWPYGALFALEIQNVHHSNYYTGDFSDGNLKASTVNNDLGGVLSTAVFTIGARVAGFDDD